MIILGIHDGHNSGASLLKDGELLCSILEERITRNKNEVGYPKNSINEVLKISNINKNDIDFICYSSNFILKIIFKIYLIGTMLALMIREEISYKMLHIKKLYLSKEKLKE